MSVGTGCPMVCGYCGRPIASEAKWLGGTPYHSACTESPGYDPGTIRFYPPGQLPIPTFTPAMTEDDVRRIVREEIERTGLLNNPNA